MLRDHDKTAVFALLVRQIEAQDLRLRAAEKLASAQTDMASAEADIKNVRSALSVFGLRGTEELTLWDAVKDAIGKKLYRQAFRVARPQEEHDNDYDEEDNQQGISENKSDFNSERTQDEQDIIPNDFEKGSANKITDTPIKDMVIQILRDLGDSGGKASAIKSKIAARGIDMHYKTVGMTLYRLSKDGVVRRDGRTWFYIPEEEQRETTYAGATQTAKA